MMDEKKLKEVCKLGQGSETCRYLGMGIHGFRCFKHNHAMASLINARVESGRFNALGDNCEGEEVVKQ